MHLQSPVYNFACVLRVWYCTPMDTVNIRVRRTTHKKLLARAKKERRTLIETIDLLSNLLIETSK